MKVKTTVGEHVFDVVDIVLTASLAFVILVPLLSILWSSLSDPVEEMAHKGLMFWPKGFTFSAYSMVFKNKNILTGYRNTLFIVLVGTSLNLLMTLVGAYVLSRKHVFWGRFMTLFVVFTMYFQGGTIPFYLTVKAVHLDGTIWSLIIPAAVNTFNLIVMRTSMAAVPDSLPESAMMDGASHTRILFSIMVPLTQATLAVITLYYAVSHWNSWFNAMIFLRDKSLYPLQLILREILIQDETASMSAGTGNDFSLVSDTIKYATIMVATLPILCVYPFLQRYFVKGVMVGAVKG